MFAKVLAGSAPTNAERVGLTQRAVLVHAVNKNFGWRGRGAGPWRIAHVTARIAEHPFGERRRSTRPQRGE
eukprot:3347008-Prymnesium_polylepis.1